jgi:DNA-binding response OmpR family regulator
MDLTEIFKDMHVDGYLIKPFESARLLSEVEVILHNQYWRSKDGHARRVMIVDDNELSSSMIATLFSEVGYTCEVAGSGVQAIEKITSDPPDLAVVSLSLADLSGDVVILRLQNMAKTRYVKYILYVQKNYMHEKAILEQFSHKTGVKVMCEYNKPIEIVEAVINVFNHS